jgi:menaquinone-9 beta-reductase
LSWALQAGEIVYDAIVCGAGPAGSIAATVMARGGARVLLLDRARFPRPKLCGDTINPGARAVLRRLDLLDAIEPQAMPIDGMIVTGEGDVRISASYRGAPGLAIERRHLDAALLQAAVAAGVRFEERVLVRGPLVDRSGGDVRVRGIVIASRDGSDLRVPAPIVIAADGRRSRLAIPLGLARHPARPRRWAVGAYMEGVAGVGTFGEMHVRRGRYIGIAPVPSGQTNVCLVVPHTVALADPRGVLLAAVAADPALRERFASARLTDSPVVIGPLAVDARTAGIPGLLLAGDAAGFIDPMTGDGLRFAFRGGELAGAVAVAALAGRVARPHEVLTRARRREFSAKWRFNRSLRRLVDHDLTVGLAARAAHAAPWLLRRTVAFAGDVPAR